MEGGRSGSTRLGGQPLGLWLAAVGLAWTAGRVVPAAPGGLGVFEAVLLFRLGTLVPEAPLLAVALSYRLIVTLADLIAAAAVKGDAWMTANVRL